MGSHTMTLNHIPGRYLCSVSVRHIPASHPWHISPHILGTHSCIIPQGQSYPCQMGPQCLPTLKVKKEMLATPVDCASQGLSFIGMPVLCYLNRSFFFSLQAKLLLVIWTCIYRSCSKKFRQIPKDNIYSFIPSRRLVLLNFFIVQGGSHCSYL